MSRADTGRRQNDGAAMHMSPVRDGIWPIHFHLLFRLQSAIIGVTKSHVSSDAYAFAAGAHDETSMLPCREQVRRSGDRKRNRTDTDTLCPRG